MKILAIFITLLSSIQVRANVFEFTGNGGVNCSDSLQAIGIHLYRPDSSNALLTTKVLVTEFGTDDKNEHFALTNVILKVHSQRRIRHESSEKAFFEDYYVDTTVSGQSETGSYEERFPLICDRTLVRK